MPTVGASWGLARLMKIAEGSWLRSYCMMATRVTGFSGCGRADLWGPQSVLKAT